MGVTAAGRAEKTGVEKDHLAQALRVLVSLAGSIKSSGKLLKALTSGKGRLCPPLQLPSRGDLDPGLGSQVQQRT